VEWKRPKLVIELDLSVRYPVGDGYNEPCVTNPFGGSVPSEDLVGHLAVDYKVDEVPVHPFTKGTVCRVFRENKGDYGRHIIVKHELSDGRIIFSFYAHLDSIRAGVQDGVEVDPTIPIATSGDTGVTTGPHLHFAIFRVVFPVAENVRVVNVILTKQACSTVPRGYLRDDLTQDELDNGCRFANKVYYDPGTVIESLR
jgi:hypothetical protein